MCGTGSAEPLRPCLLQWTSSGCKDGEECPVVGSVLGVLASDRPLLEPRDLGLLAQFGYNLGCSPNRSGLFDRGFWYVDVGHQGVFRLVETGFVLLLLFRVNQL